MLTVRKQLYMMHAYRVSSVTERRNVGLLYTDA